MNETHEDRVKILSASEVGATHFDGKNYLKFDECGDSLLINGNRCIYRVMALPEIRSLADIQKQVDMQNEIDELKFENSKLNHRIYEHNCRVIGAPIPRN